MPQVDGSSDRPTYEERLARDSRWALSEGSRHFEDGSAVHKALRKITRRLDELDIPYVVAGGMALFRHGLRRFTEDVDILVTPQGLEAIHEKLPGLGYRPPFAGSKDLRDTELGVRIEFLVTGGFPGDGKPKPVAFPDPAAVLWRRDDVNYVTLPTLVEMKLASGMTSPQRMKDLADVQELIKLLDLPIDFAQQLNPYVRDRFAELWTAARQVSSRYMRIWEDPSLTRDVKTIDDMIEALPDAAGALAAMKSDGVVLDPRRRPGPHSVYLTTTDPDVAQTYDMHDESEFRQGSD